MCLSVFALKAQEVTFELDYSISYVIEKSKDTITLGIGDGGRYLYTDSQIIGSELGRSLTELIPTASEDTRAKILVDLAKETLLIHAQVDDNSMLVHLNMKNFLPKEIDTDKQELLSATRTSETKSLLGQNYELYQVFSKKNEANYKWAAFDPKYPLDYTENLSSLIGSFMESNVTFDFPNGILTYMENSNGTEMSRAISLKEEKKYLTANLSLNEVFKP